MEQFLKLPLYQRILAVLGVLLVIFGADYFLYVSDYNDAITAELIKHRKLDKEYTSLMPYQDDEQLKKFREAFEAEEEKIKANKKMLPSEEEIPEFVKSIYTDAKLSGLMVVKIEKKEEEGEDYYKKIPIHLEVRGDYHQLLKFCRTITAPKKRIVNIANLELMKLPIDMDKIQKEMGQSALQFWEQRQIEKKLHGKKMTGPEARIYRVRKWEEANKMAMFKAKFTVYTFSYTGKPMSAEERKKKLKKKRMKRRK